MMFKFVCATRTAQHAEKLASVMPQVKRAPDFVIFKETDRVWLSKLYHSDRQAIYRALHSDSTLPVPSDDNQLIERILGKLASITPETVLEDEVVKEGEVDVENGETTVADATTEIPVSAKKSKSKSKSKKPTKAKKVAKSVKKSGAKKVIKRDWPTPFRPGTAKEKAYGLFAKYQKTYNKLERGGKGEWIEKTAKALGVEKTTLASWIGGQFKAALK